MKYKVGDKVKVRSDLVSGELYGALYARDEMCRLCGEIATIETVYNEYYRIVESGYCWTEEMLEPVEEELTAEEAIKIQAEMCGGVFCNDCKISFRNNGMGIKCSDLRQKHPERVVKVLKQYKKDHEKKEIEVVKKTCCLVIDEKRTVVHEEEIDNHDSCEEVLKRYCEEHDGKFLAICESRYAVKE